MRRLFSFFRSGAQTAAESTKYTHPKRPPSRGRLPDAVTHPKGKSLSTGLAPTRKPIIRRRLLLPKSLADHADLFPPKAEKSANARRLFPQTGHQSDARAGLCAFSGSP